MQEKLEKNNLLCLISPTSHRISFLKNQYWEHLQDFFFIQGQVLVQKSQISTKEAYILWMTP